MKVIQLNTTCGSGSTGKICQAISEIISKEGIENYIFYTQGNSNYHLGRKYASYGYKKLQALKSRVFGNLGFNSHYATWKMIRSLEAIAPDLIHIHNIHGHDCHLGILLRYLKRKKVRVLWTFHDCWAFTGSCPYYTLARCDRWKHDCSPCPEIRQTSWFFDRSKTLLQRKKRLMDGLDMTIVTPSQWLADQVKQSFLKNYPVKVIRNGIDLEMFKPTESDFRQKHQIGGKRIVLGVAFGWGARKGLDVFCRLAVTLGEQYQIVLVGTDAEVDKTLPDNIISIHRTNNQQELAQIYSAADVFVIPTREENFPTVNIEALACGTPVVTFKTGGSPEIIDETCGMVVPCDDLEALEQAIRRVGEEKPFSAEACIKRAKEFDMWKKFGEYIELYREMSH